MSDDNLASKQQTDKTHLTVTYTLLTNNVDSTY